MHLAHSRSADHSGTGTARRWFQRRSDRPVSMLALGDHEPGGHYADLGFRPPSPVSAVPAMAAAPVAVGTGWMAHAS